MGAFHLSKPTLGGGKNGFGTNVGLSIQLPLSSVRNNLDRSARNWRSDWYVIDWPWKWHVGFDASSCFVRFAIHAVNCCVSPNYLQEEMDVGYLSFCLFGSVCICLSNRHLHHLKVQTDFKCRTFPFEWGNPDFAEVCLVLVTRSG